LTDAAVRGQLDLPGRRLLAALQAEPMDQNQLASALGFSRTVRMVLLLCVIAFSMRFDDIDLVLAFLCSGVFMGAGTVGAAAVAWLLVQATDWRRRMATGGTARVLRRFTGRRPGTVQTWGLVLMTAGAAASWAGPALGLSALLPVGLGLAGLGMALAVPNDVQGTLVGLGGLCYLAIVGRGMPLAHAILLTAWLFCGIPMLSSGRFRQLVGNGLTLQRAIAASVVAIPVALAWVASRWGYRLALWCMLVAAAAQMRPFPISVPSSSRFILLPICLAAGYYARAGAMVAGRWLAARFR